MVNRPSYPCPQGEEEEDKTKSLPPNMCRYIAFTHSGCGHLCFKVAVFCNSLYNELQRINDPYQRQMYALPFDPPDCRPRLGYNIIDYEPGGWRYCPTCLENLLGGTPGFAGYYGRDAR